MATRVRVSQVAALRRSMEVQHASKGAGRMLRRGLHGSKNWVLELDENGEHRSVWAKAGRVLVVLVPLWVVLSAVTDGPERGGHSTSVPQALGAALIVTLVGLAVFSARERRLGREEPWRPSRREEDSFTESDNEGEATQLDPSPEEPTQAVENPQVTRLSFDGNGAFHVDNSYENEQNTQIVDVLVPQATLNDGNTLAVAGIDGIAEPVHKESDQTTSEGAVDHADESERNTVRNAPMTPSVAPIVSLNKATFSSASTQVIRTPEGAEPSVPQATVNTPESETTDSDRNDLEDSPTVPFRSAFRAPFHETESPQVSVDAEQVQGTDQVQFPTLLAEAGPYPALDEPEADDWWLTKPDMAPGDPEGDAVADPAPKVPEEPYDPWSGPGEGSRGAGHITCSGPYPQEVQRYFASRVSVDVGEQEKEAARDAVMAWAVGEVSSGRRSQSEVARLLGLGKATVSRWVNADG